MLAGALIALMAGVFISVQGSLNAMVGTRASVGAVISIPVLFQLAIYTGWILLNQNFRREVFGIFELRFGVTYLLLSALLGIGIMVTMTLSFMKVGPLLALSLVVFSQLAISMAIEHFGCFGTQVTPVSLIRVAGLALMLLGTFLFAQK